MSSNRRCVALKGGFCPEEKALQAVNHAITGADKKDIISLRLAGCMVIALLSYLGG
jgi:hypothetical protein